MPQKVVDTLKEIHGNLIDEKVVVLGASYRGGVKETAFSGVFATVAALEKLGAKVLVHDPLFDKEELENLGLVPYSYGDIVDAVVVQTDHMEYRDLDSKKIPSVRTIIDGRNVINESKFPGIRFHNLGKPKKKY